MGTTAQGLLLPLADVGIVVLVNRAVGQASSRAVQRFTAETVLEREHAPDADEVSESAAMLGLRRLGRGTSSRRLQPATPETLASYVLAALSRDFVVKNRSEHFGN
jgi:hypothetical protein